MAKTISATYTIGNIKNEMELMSLSGTIAGWMITHPQTNLDHYDDETTET